jgi:hypothetical protein
MFQFAYGRNLSLKYSTILKLDLSNFSEYRRNGLGIFNLNTPFANMLFFDRRNLSVTQKILFRIKHWQAKTFLFSENNLDESLTFPANLCKYNFVVGHFQNEKYFESVTKTIRKDFTFPRLPEGALKNLGNAIIKSNSVSIHVRRGDYLLKKNMEVHGILPITYYNDAMNQILKKIKDPLFFIFSDDIEWAKKHLMIHNNSTFIEPIPNKPDYIDMQLMSLCKHNIIANSSFSWWGAWLNNNSEKIVIAPTKWFQIPEMNELHKNIVPSSWLKI